MKTGNNNNNNITVLSSLQRESTAKNTNTQKLSFSNVIIKPTLTFLAKCNSVEQYHFNDSDTGNFIPPIEMINYFPMA